MGWEQAKTKLQHYRRRQPEESPLYRIVYHGRDDLPRVWEDWFQPTYGVLRDEVLETFIERGPLYLEKLPITDDFA